MRTTKPISTIAFNTPEYLQLKLEELTKAGRLTFWAFIGHKPEDDEGGKKFHYHVYLEPSKMLQTEDLRQELKEFDPRNPSKPLGCLPFESSNFDNWYMYILHDRRYLASKNQSRRYHYTHDEVVSPDPDYLLFKVRKIDLVSLSPYADMEDAQRNGISWEEYFSRGTVPILQVNQFEKAWYMLLHTHTDRNGRNGHAMEVNPDTGEIVEPESFTKPTPEPLDTSAWEQIPIDDALPW